MLTGHGADIPKILAISRFGETCDIASENMGNIDIPEVIVDHNDAASISYLTDTILVMENDTIGEMFLERETSSNAADEIINTNHTGENSNDALAGIHTEEKEKAISDAASSSIQANVTEDPIVIDLMETSTDIPKKSEKEVVICSDTLGEVMGLANTCTQE